MQRGTPRPLICPIAPLDVPHWGSFRRLEQRKTKLNGGALHLPWPLGRIAILLISPLSQPSLAHGIMQRTNCHGPQLRNPPPALSTMRATKAAHMMRPPEHRLVMIGGGGIHKYKRAGCLFMASPRPSCAATGEGNESRNVPSRHLERLCDQHRVCVRKSLWHQPAPTRIQHRN